MKKVYVFDLDGTLAKSKSPIDSRMQEFLPELLRMRRVCIVSGGRWQQFEDQLLSNLRITSELKARLFLFPTSGATHWSWNTKDGAWQRQYCNFLGEDEKQKIKRSLARALEKSDKPKKTWGDLIEDRHTQITYSALGQLAPHSAKKLWDPDKAKRGLIADLLKVQLPEFEIRIGGTTSIDITKPGIHKGYAVKKICEILDVKTDDLIFFGDAIEPGGNDHEVYKSGVMSVPVDSHIDCLWKVQMMLDQGI